MSNSLNLELPYVAGGQAQKHVTVNDAFRRIDSVVQLTVEDRDQTAPPVSPQEGERHVVAAPASGAWAGQEFNVAAYQDGAWVFFEPREGWLAFSRSEQALILFNGTSWEIFTAVGAAQTASIFGVNGTADTSKRLQVFSEGVQFAPDGTTGNPTGNVRVYVNKTGVAGTAAHIFQRGYSGRAEFGLLGSDDFSLKVSDDGNTFTEAFAVGAADARVDFSQLPAIGGSDALLLSFATRADAAAASIPAAVNHIEVRGYSAENDGGGARYFRVGSLPADGLGFGNASAGFWSLLGDTVTAKQAGAAGNGATNDTGALIRAFTSGRNVYLDTGTYYVTDQLTSGAIYQRVFGAGRGKAVIKVDNQFRMNAAGVIKLSHSFTSLEDFTIDFDQSSASSRATLIQYPAAVNLVDRTRVRLARLRFQRAYNGVLADGNCGGAIFDDVECGSFNIGFKVAGSLDTVELRNCRVWPYDFAGSAVLYGIYSDGATYGFRIGECDDLKMTNCTPFRSRILFEKTGTKAPFGTVNGLALDGRYSSIEMQDGQITISGLYASTDVANDKFIFQTGGSLAISDFRFSTNTISNVPMVHVAGLEASCLIQNGRALMGASATAEGFLVAAGKLTVSNVSFSLNPTVTRATAACIRQAADGQLTAFGNTVNGPSTGSGRFIWVQTDGHHSVFGNDSNGWALDFPALRTLGTYGPNHDGNALRLDTVLAVGPVDSGSEGGELRLDGAGSNAAIRVDNSAGNARFFTLGAGKSLKVISADGTGSLYGNRLEFSGGLALGRGASDELSSVSLGEFALSSVTSGSNNLAIGRGAFSSMTSGNGNIAIGQSAGLSSTSGTGNVFCGSRAGSTMTTESGSTLVGFKAGEFISGGGNNTAVGRTTFSNISGSLTNATALGFNATVQGSNQVQLGNSATTTYAYGAVQNRSDARDKTDVRDTVLGLEFVRALRPVDFRWDYREDYLRPADAEGDWEAPAPGSMARLRYHHGFLAQDVETLIGATGCDFGGYQDHAINGGNDVKSLGYEELLAPLVKAVQELCVRLDALEACDENEQD
ncbi:DUF2793 domain-containing protein [Acuticoccus sp. MNP-M23]|uniref:DUF2793 domain-containing protein n=1 Tax=Acuticoccus sp. MNP-M23 TaxID=3072793 RepID=UPI002814E6D5|nr:DUF2793 domain-containing protein [Acuticoccus sp. MNP-M23]WMS41704.1 DUF2793 domain-containing protein [Acuticoccus sp. MNP-M23]